MHLKSSRFSIIGREFKWGDFDCTIIDQIGPARYLVKIKDIGFVNLDRSEFKLPPGDPIYPIWLSDLSNGFAYGPEFNNDFAKVST